MSDFYYGLQLDREDHGGAVRHTLRDGETVLGAAVEQADGTTSITIVEAGQIYRPDSTFMMVDDALMAIKTYHDVRRTARREGRPQP